MFKCPGIVARHPNSLKQHPVSLYLSLLSPNLQSSKTKIKANPKPGQTPPNDDTLLFGAKFTDHMLTIDWDSKTGWHAPEIKPFGNLTLHPAASTLHYALQCFEGMKAYKDANGTPRLFRPDRNMKRLHDSTTRLAMPGFDQEELLECIKQLVRQDERWIPQKDGFSLYIRPTMIATEPTLGVATPRQAQFFCIMCPVGPYYAEGFKPVKLYAQEKYTRACPGGMGSFKAGGNYAAGILPASEAAQRGCTQVLWLYGPQHQVTEVGTMNMFFLWKTKEGETELVTSAITDEMTLPGVTRRSIIELCQEWGIKTREGYYTMEDVTAAIEDGRVRRP